MKKKDKEKESDDRRKDEGNRKRRKIRKIDGKKTKGQNKNEIESEELERKK